MEGTAEPGTEGFGREIQRLETYFYAEDGILASTRANRIQREVYVLTKLFELVGMRTNVEKTVSTACQTCSKIAPPPLYGFL